MKYHLIASVFGIIVLLSSILILVSTSEFITEYGNYLYSLWAVLFIAMCYVEYQENKRKR